MAFPEILRKAIAITISLVIIISLPRICHVLWGILYVEINALQNELSFTRPIYPHGYILIFIVKVIFFIIGIVAVARFLIPKVVRILPKYKDNRNDYLTLLACFLWSLFAVGLYRGVEAVYEWKEESLKKAGYIPGVFYWFPDYSDSLVKKQFIAADETGMPYFERPRPWFNINSQGFIADFEYDHPTTDSFRKLGKKIIFIIGDSFVEGLTKNVGLNYDSVFVEILREESSEYAFYSFGVAGSGPVEYELIAQRFIPELKPDLTLIAFCWNDVMSYEIAPRPCVPKHFETNWGMLPGIVPLELSRGRNVTLSSAREAADYYERKFTLWTQPDYMSRICRKSVMLTELYSKIRGLPEITEIPADDSVTYRHLNSIHNICSKEGSKFAIAVIPDLERIDELTSVEKNQKAYDSVFKGLMPFVHFSCLEISDADYISSSNKHFNHSGNRKFAAFLDSIIDNQIEVHKTN